MTPPEPDIAPPNVPPFVPVMLRSAFRETLWATVAGELKRSVPPLTDRPCRSFDVHALARHAIVEACGDHGADEEHAENESGDEPAAHATTRNSRV